MKCYYVLIILVLILFGCSPYVIEGPNNRTWQLVSNDSYVTADGKVYEYAIYPNYNLSPGDVMSTNATEICVVGYSKSVRDVSQSTKDKVYARYGITKRLPYEYEVDHIISLQLGGSNEISNLWPEPYNHTLGARKKDVVENWLHKEVCEDRMSIEEAQHIIVYNWTTYYDMIKS